MHRVGYALFLTTLACVSAARVPAFENTFTNVKQRIGEIEEVSIVQENGHVIELPTVEQSLLRKAISRCRPMQANWARTPQPWPAVIRATSKRNSSWFLGFTMHTLRMDTATPQTPTLRSITTGTPTVQDCQLDADDHDAIWALMERHLGKTQEKSYLIPKIPAR